MRILAVSDIHNNVACVRKLRAQEENEFDVVVVAGDIGGRRATEIFQVLTSFGCPVVYVYGNWDGDLAHDTNFGLDCHLVHLNVVNVGTLSFTGFSEFRPERNPHGSAVREDRAEYYRRYGDMLTRSLRKSGVDLGRTVVVTHARLARLTDQFPGLLLHIYGHIHGFEAIERKGSMHVNVSALDRLIPVLPASKKDEASGLAKRDLSTLLGPSIRHVNAGNYAKIEASHAGRVSVECRFLQHGYDGWFAIPGRAALSGQLVPEEESFEDDRYLMRETQ